MLEVDENVLRPLHRSLLPIGISQHRRTHYEDLTIRNDTTPHLAEQRGCKSVADVLLVCRRVSGTKKHLLTMKENRPQDLT